MGSPTRETSIKAGGSSMPGNAVPALVSPSTVATKPGPVAVDLEPSTKAGGSLMVGSSTGAGEFFDRGQQFQGEAWPWCGRPRTHHQAGGSMMVGSSAGAADQGTDPGRVVVELHQAGQWSSMPDSGPGAAEAFDRGHQARPRCGRPRTQHQAGGSLMVGSSTGAGEFFDRGQQFQGEAWPWCGRPRNQHQGGRVNDGR